MAQIQDFILHLKSKHVLTARCLMSLIGLLASTEKMVPEGRLHMRPFQFHLKEHWKFPQPLDSLLPWTEAISAHLDWWQNPANVMEGSDLHPKDHSIQLFTDASNEGWGAHLEQSSTQGLWSPQEKGLHINVLELKAVFLALRHFKDQCQDQTVLVATDNSTVVAYINKQGGTHSAEMCALLWRLMTWCPHYHITLKARHIPAHSRVPECDGRPTFQVEPGAVDRMVSTSTGVQTDLPKVVHSPRGPFCHSSEPQAPSVRVSYPRPPGLGHRCSEHRLDGSHCLCLPSNGSPSQGDPKNQAMHLPDHTNSPRLARDALVLGPSAALNRDPSATPGVDNTPQAVPQLRVPQLPAAPQPPRLVSRSGQLQEQGFSVEVAERIAAPQRSSTRIISYYPQGTSHPWPAERDSRQAIQAWPDHSIEWSLYPEVSQAICSWWHQHQVDLFLQQTFYNKLPQFVSPVLDPQAWAVHTLRLSWEDLDPYAFPPAAILGKWWKSCRTTLATG